MLRCELRRTSLTLSLLTIIVSSGFLQSAEAQNQPAGLATEMLRSIGSKKGLCVVLGSEDGRLAVELSRDGQYLVHGLCTSREAVARARQVIDKADQRGVVSAETGSVKRLPYSDNIVNLVVVENTGTALENGLQLQEVQRVLQPGGVVWLGNWNTDGRKVAGILRGTGYRFPGRRRRLVSVAEVSTEEHG